MALFLFNHFVLDNQVRDFLEGNRSGRLRRLLELWWKIFFFAASGQSFESNVDRGLTISGGDVRGPGGGLLSLESLAIRDCRIADNHASKGGGIYVRHDPAGAVSISNSDVVENSTSATTALGGGIYVHSLGGGE